VVYDNALYKSTFTLLNRNDLLLSNSLGLAPLLEDEDEVHLNVAIK